MFTKSSVKRLTIVLVAVLVCAAVLFAACTPAQQFKPRELPAKATPVGNGGIAVLYGEWLYYVNGNIASATTANNSYSEDLRSGAVVRIKLADLESHVLSVNKMDMSSTEKTKAIQKAVRDYAEMVVPHVYYTANTASADLNGIYIFGDRIYITMPNDQLDSKGNVLNTQLILASFNLGGGDRQNHLVFETNAPQLKLSEAEGKVYATYVLDGKLMSLKVGDKEPTQIAEKITSQQFSGDYVYYLDEDGSICQYKVGAEKATVLVPLAQKEGHEDHNHKSYTIQKVNQDYVYYTISDSSSLGEPDLDGKVLYFTNAPVAEEKHTAVIKSIPTSTYFCYGDKVVYTKADDNAPSEQSRYLIVAAAGDASGADLQTLRNERASVTLTKLDGSTLYYTMNSVTYTLDLATADADPVPYAYSLSTSASGWAMPDVLNVTNGDATETYVFTISTDSVTVVKFNAETKKNSTSTNITLVAETKDEDDKD